MGYRTIGLTSNGGGLRPSPFRRGTHMEKIKYTAVYLRSGRTAFVGGTEWHQEGDDLVVYSDEGDDVHFNWANVEFFRTGETELPEETDKPAEPEIKDLDVPEFNVSKVHEGHGGYL